MGKTPVLQLVSAAFPALQSVKLSPMSFARADLGSLSACTQLVHLTPLNCQLHQSEADSITSPLSAVNSLRQLSLQGTDSSITAGLTSLTGLSLVNGHHHLLTVWGTSPA
jgi:hypothetical protein